VRPLTVALGLILAVVVLATALAAPALASKTQLSVFEDDQSLILGSDSLRERTLDDLVILGIDTVHSIVFWNRVAPDAASVHRPDGFDGSDPAAYPPELWDRYDGLVRGATVRGMDLLLSPSSPLPYWASGCTGSKKTRRTCRPNPTQFKRFVEALGKRYSGAYADENQGGGLLPRVSRWSVWNEPNQGGWLTPQFTRRNGHQAPTSPAIYRGLARAMIAGLRASGHGSDDVLFGETAPLGRSTGPAALRPMAPGDFLRRTLCIDRHGRSLRGADARALDCSGGFRKLAVTGIAHHPYTRGGSRPPTSRSGPNEITIASVARLKRIMSQAARRHRIPAHLPIFYTEFGFQTNPPDELFGLPLTLQATYLNESDWITWRDPVVKSVAQYEMRDESNPDSFQTGLRFIDGRAKPGFAAYRLPIWVVRNGSGVRVWGQVRPADDDASETVEIEHDASGNGNFRTVARTRTTNRKGFIYVPVYGQGRSGKWRLEWTPADGGPTVTSRTATVKAR
jgi:hypothetical protein